MTSSEAGRDLTSAPTPPTLEEFDATMAKWRRHGHSDAWLYLTLTGQLASRDVSGPSAGDPAPRLPPESVREKLGNALQVLSAAENVSWTKLAPDDRDGYWSFLPRESLEAVVRLLRGALSKIDAGVERPAPQGETRPQ